MDSSTFDSVPPNASGPSVQSSRDTRCPIIQINGRKVLGPPLDWKGPPPSTACELHIKRIPRYLSEESIIPHFQRFGKIYEFRLMLEFNYRNRGYAFVRYTSEEEANRAMEVLNHLYIAPGKLLQIQKSYNKCRLFVGNIPKQLKEEEIESSFRRMFPALDKVISLKRISDGHNNRGFVFIDFRSHEDALVVKKQVSPGSIRMWGHALKVVWANPERTVDQESRQKIRTLFVRNVHMSVTTQTLYDILETVVKRRDVERVSRVRELAFIRFSTRALAEAALEALQGAKLQGHPIHLEWALPPSANCVHSLKNCDYDAVLRLKCIANYWSIPVVVFGRVFEADQVQYATVLIRSEFKVHSFFLELDIASLTDIQSRLCEVILNLVGKCGGLPVQNYVIKVKDDEAHIVGMMSDVQKRTFVVAQRIESDMFIHRDELLDLCTVAARVSAFPFDALHAAYIQALNTPRTVFLEVPLLYNRILVPLNPSYRRRPPLKFNIDNRQIVLVLCHSLSMTNFIFLNMRPLPLNLRDSAPGRKTTGSTVSYRVLNLVSGHFAQPKNVPLVINAVRFGEVQGSFF